MIITGIISFKFWKVLLYQYLSVCLDFFTLRNTYRIITIDTFGLIWSSVKKINPLIHSYSIWFAYWRGCPLFICLWGRHAFWCRDLLEKTMNPLKDQEKIVKPPCQIRKYHDPPLFATTLIIVIWDYLMASTPL